MDNTNIKVFPSESTIPISRCFQGDGMFLTVCGVTEYGSGGHYPTLSILCPESPILIILQRYASKIYPKPDHIISFYKLTYSAKYGAIPK